MNKRRMENLRKVIREKATLAGVIVPNEMMSAISAAVNQTDDFTAEIYTKPSDVCLHLRLWGEPCDPPMKNSYDVIHGAAQPVPPGEDPRFNPDLPFALLNVTELKEQYWAEAGKKRLGNFILYLPRESRLDLIIRNTREILENASYEPLSDEERAEIIRLHSLMYPQTDGAKSLIDAQTSDKKPADPGRGKFFIHDVIMRYFPEKNRFIGGVVVDGYQYNDDIVWAYMDEDVHDDPDNFRARLCSFSSTSPESLRSWEYHYLRENPEFLKSWIEHVDAKGFDKEWFAAALQK